MIFLLVYSAAVMVFLRWLGANLFRPDFFFTVVLFVSSLTYFEPIIVSDSELQPSVALFIAANHLAFVSAYLGIYRYRVARYHEPPQAAWNESVFVLALKIATVFFVVLMTFQAINDRSIPIMANLSNLQDLRNQHWAGELSRGTFERLYSATSHFAFLYVVIFLVARNDRNYSGVLAILAMMFLIDYALSTGGRALIVMLFIATVAVFSISPVYSKSRGLVAAMIGIAVFIIGGGYLYLLRNPNFSEAPMFFVAHVCANSYLSEIGRGLPTIFQALSMQGCYFHNPPFKMEVFLESIDWTWPYSLGGYNLSVLIRFEFAEIRNDIFHVYRSNALGGNPWATSGRDFFLDFGFFAPMFSAVLGALIGRLSPVSRCITAQSAALYAVLACFAFWLPFLSPLVIRPVVYPLLIVVILPILLELVPRRNVR